MSWILEFGRIFRIGIDSTRDTKLLGRSNTIVLDPLTTLFRLSILRYMPEFTKIAFDSNGLHLQQGDSLIQAPLRQFRGDSRDDIHYLNNPLSLSEEWVDDHECGDLKCELFEYGRLGLNVLEETYKENGQTATHALRHYKNYLNERPRSSETNSPRSRSDSGSSSSVEMDFNRNMNPIYANIKHKVWNQDEIRLVCNLLRLINRNKKERESLIQALSIILDSKEEVTKTLISNILTGQSEIVE